MSRTKTVNPETYFDRSAPWFIAPQQSDLVVQVMRVDEPIHFEHYGQRVDMEVGDGLVRLEGDNGAPMFIPVPRDVMRERFSRATRDGEIICDLKAPILEQAGALDRAGAAFSAHQTDLLQQARIDDPEARKVLLSDVGPWARIKHVISDLVDEIKEIVGQPSHAAQAQEYDDRRHQRMRL